MKKNFQLPILSFLILVSLVYHFSHVKSKLPWKLFSSDLTIVRYETLETTTKVQQMLRSDLKIDIVQTKEILSSQAAASPISLPFEKKLGPVILFEENFPSLLANPSAKAPLSSKHIKIAYLTMESSKIPASWVKFLNTHFDAIVAPDSFFVETCKNSGVTIPTFVIPPIVDLSLLLRQEIKSQKNTPFVFGNFSFCEDKQNTLTLLRAFAKAFQDRPDVALHIYYKKGDPKLIGKIQKEISKRGLSNVSFVHSEVRNERYLNDFKQLDCYISLAKGEAFAIEAKEAMALGIPVIATDNTAQSALCKTGLIRPVQAPILEPAGFFEGEPMGYIFNCSIEDAKKAMLDVYQNYDKYLKNAQKAREWASQYSSTSLRKLYLSLIKPNKVILGKTNQITPDFLETTSPELYEKYQKLFP